MEKPRSLTLGEAELVLSRVWKHVERANCAKSCTPAPLPQGRGIGKTKDADRGLACVDLSVLDKFEFTHLGAVRYKLRSVQIARRMSDAGLFASPPKAIMEATRVNRFLYELALKVLHERGADDAAGVVLEWHDKRRVLKGARSRGAGIVVDEAGLQLLAEALERAIGDRRLTSLPPPTPPSSH